MSLIAQLSQQHRSIEALSANLLRLVRAPSPDRDAIAALRWKLTRELTVHLALEESVIYQQLRNSGEVSAVQTASSFERELGALSGDLRCYMCSWSCDRIDADWSAFRDATIVLLASLQMRIRREDRVLYPLAARTLRCGEARRISG